jgi:hypothetical protein
MSAAATVSKSVARGAIAQGAKLWPHKTPALGVSSDVVLVVSLHVSSNIAVTSLLAYNF